MTRRPTFPLRIVERRYLNQGSPDLKETYHLVLDLSDTPIEYEVGDCLAIYPHNSSSLVSKFLDILPFSPDQIVSDNINLETFLTLHVNLAKGSKHLKEKVGSDFDNSLEALKTIPLDFLSIDEIPNLFAKQLPRFYSICSSMKYVGKEAHLIVALAKNPDGALTEYGTCSDFLCKTAPLGEPVISAYHHASPHFFLPASSDTPIIMIGPGTGIAPFRGFMQERALHSTSTKNWLFFGEKRAEYDFFYKEEWNDWVNCGKLRLETAFSRDSDQKVYVQHKLKEHREEVWDWLEKGAYLYVCGDAKQMAKAVDASLKEVAMHVGGLSEENASSYLKELRAVKRYQRDVY
jgi:sulfite reductase (NADPH) flavoprotein alpha-component